MRKVKMLAAVAILAAGVVSCKDFSLSSFIKGDAIATAGDAQLYFDDLKSIFTPGMTPEDSLELLNSYIDVWIKHQLKVQMAHENLTDEEKDIEKLVEDYRNSLLIYKFEQSFINKHMDTTLTEAAIEEYYKQNIADYSLPHPLMKATVVKVPVGFRQETGIRSLARSGKSESLQDIIDICIKNNLKYDDFSEWTDFATVAGALPRLSAKDYDALKSDRDFMEITEEGNRYFIIVSSRMPEGSAQPLSMVKSAIKVSLLNKRKQEVIKMMEDSIYNYAKRQGNLKIKTTRQQ